jgi:hypothetical protein
LRVVACERLVAEVRPKPGWDQRSVATSAAILVKTWIA